MNHKDKQEFTQLMVALTEAFGQEATPIKMQVYFKALEDLKIEDIAKSVWALIRTRTTATFPKVAEIREATHGRPEDQAQLAWQKFIGAVRDHGGHATVIFDDPVIHAIVEREGGWIKVTEYDHEKMGWFAKDFIRIYQAYLPNVDKLAIPEKLMGIYEFDNVGKFPDYVPAPALIGDERKILEWQGRHKEIRKSTVADLVPKLMNTGEET